MLKRDHVQGFDRLDQSAFEDALAYFGFDPDIIEFERARLRDCRIRVKSQDGICEESFLTSGQTRQGDACPSLRYAFSIALLLVKAFTGAARHFPPIGTMSSALQTIHDDPKFSKVVLRLLEATDDSLIVARSWNSLGELTKLAEAFQYAYNIVTNWGNAEKTVAFTLGKAPPDAPQSIEIDVSSTRTVSQRS